MKESNQTKKKHTIIDDIRSYFSKLVEMPLEKMSIGYILNINTDTDASLTKEDVEQFFNEKNALRAVNAEPGEIIPDSTNNKCINIEREEFINSIMEHKHKELVIYLVDLLADKGLLNGENAKNIFTKIIGTHNTAIRNNLLLLQKTDLFKNNDNIITIINKSTFLNQQELKKMHEAGLFNTDIENRKTYFNAVCDTNWQRPSYGEILRMLHKNNLLNNQNEDRLPRIDRCNQIILLKTVMQGLEEINLLNDRNFKFATEGSITERFDMMMGKIRHKQARLANTNPTHESSSENVQVQAPQSRQPSTSTPVASTSGFFSTQQSEQSERTVHARKKPKM